MRLLWAGLLIPVLQITASAGTLLSVSAVAGAQSCQTQSTTGIASCSVSANVPIPAAQFDSPVSASGTISFGHTAYSAGTLLGPQSVGTLDYSLAGSWSMGQGIGLNDQVSVSLSAALTLPTHSGDWTFYSSVFDATDDSGGALGPIQIVTTDGNIWLSGGFPSTMTIHHAVGTPFVVSIELSDFVADADSSNNLSFDLRMVDPISTPEPFTLFTALLGLAVGAAFIAIHRNV